MQHWKTSENLMGGWLPYLAEDRDHERRDSEIKEYEKPSDRAPMVGFKSPLH